MKKHTTISKALALCSAALIVAAFTLNNVAQAATLYCYYASAAGGTGCMTGDGCPFWEPNVGVVYNNTLTCGYDGNNLVYAQVGQGTCVQNANGGCCNNIDTNRHCPSASLCPSTPTCTAPPGGGGN